MKKIILIFICFLLFASCNSDLIHLEILNQVKNNLEIENNISLLFNERNITLSELLIQARIQKYNIDKSKFIKIDSLSLKLSTELNNSIKKISFYKNKNPNNEFYVATFRYLKKIKEIETVIHPFLESIKDTIKNNELSLSKLVNSKALKIVSETDNWNKAKFEFYQKNKIEQKEIDSIIKLIETK